MIGKDGTFGTSQALDDKVSLDHVESIRREDRSLPSVHKRQRLHLSDLIAAKTWLPIFSGNGTRCINRPRNESLPSLLLTGREKLWRFRRALELLYVHAVTGP